MHIRTYLAVILLVGLMGTLPTAPAAAQSDQNWLTRINYLRAQGGLPPVTEHPTMSDHALLAAEYVVYEDHFEHFQDPNNPRYTPEGHRAQRDSNLLAGSWWYESEAVGDRFDVVRSEPEHAIDGWLTSPSHFFGMVDDRTEQVGFGWLSDPREPDDLNQDQYAMAAVLHNVDIIEAPPRSSAFLWPADGAVLPVVADIAQCPDQGTALIHAGAAAQAPVPQVSATRGGVEVPVTTEPVWDDGQTVVAAACVDAGDVLTWAVDFGGDDVRSVEAAYRAIQDIPGYPVTPRRLCLEDGSDCPVDAYPVRPDGYVPCPHPQDDPSPCTPQGLEAPSPVPTGGPFSQADPVARAVAVSQHRFPDGEAPRVVLARVDEVADSLAASALLGDGPLLLSPTASLAPAARAEIERVLAAGGVVHLMGGEAALSEAVAEELRGMGLAVERAAGPTRIETALAVADLVVELHGLEGLGAVQVARAFGTAGNPTAAWADAISGGALAAGEIAPVLLTPTEQLHPDVRVWLEEVDHPRTYLLGGTAALSDAVAAELPGSTRLSGASRDETAARINEARTDREPGGLAVAFDGYGESGWVDGLLAAGLAADGRATTLLVAPDSVPPATAALHSAGCTELLVVGPTVQQGVADQLAC